MIVALFILGMIGGMFIPFQTSINTRLSAYTKSSIYTSTISFGVGVVFLLLLNAFTNPHMLTIPFFSDQTYHYYWFTGGLIGVLFLTGNLLLLPRIGASLTVVVSLIGQVIMGVTIDVLGWFDAPYQSFTAFNMFGIVLLISGVILMNYVKDNGQKKVNMSFYFWLITGGIIGFGPPIQTAINSKLGQQVQSSFMASLVSFSIGFIVLLIIKTITNKNFKLVMEHKQHGRLKPVDFIGGVLGVIFITANIYLMPYLGAALTTIAGMLGQMVIAIIIDHIGLFGIQQRKITRRKILGIIIVIAGILLLRLL